MSRTCKNPGCSNPTPDNHRYRFCSTECREAFNLFKVREGSRLVTLISENVPHTEIIRELRGIMANFENNEGAQTK